MNSINYAQEWDESIEFEPRIVEEKPNMCDYSERFSPWTLELYDRVAHNSTNVGVNQAKLQLTDKYMEWRNSVPKRHRNYTGTGHVCIFHVFEAAYNRLRVLELSLTPPMLFLPQPPPPPPPPPQIAGIFIGELDEG